MATASCAGIVGARDCRGARWLVATAEPDLGNLAVPLAAYVLPTNLTTTQGKLPMLSVIIALAALAELFFAACLVLAPSLPMPLASALTLVVLLFCSGFLTLGL